MSKKFLGGFIVLVVALASVVLWILNLLAVNGFAWFNTSVALGIIATALGLVLTFQSFKKDLGTLKKIRAFMGIVILALGVVLLILGFALVDEETLQKIIIPIIVGVVVLGILIGYLVTGGKKWDAGDNEKVGYKTYAQRKAEEEKQEKNNEK
ncbi:MAG: hypothetical protein LBV55_01350 [Acholeplasmatales bacterium]|jgi:hypothetical protein|nr:hypothetical protein [Acholeplasmatales bacterium]